MTDITDKGSENNKIAEVAKLFDLELYEEFTVTTEDYEGKYRFTDTGIQYYLSVHQKWITAYILEKLIYGSVQIERGSQKTVDSQENYAWHNLKENRVDLPKECENVLCCTAKDGYVTLYRKGEWWIDPAKDDEVYSTTRVATYVQGWKYIEEFN